MPKSIGPFLVTIADQRTETVHKCLRVMMSRLKMGYDLKKLGYKTFQVVSAHLTKSIYMATVCSLFAN